MYPHCMGRGCCNPQNHPVGRRQSPQADVFSWPKHWCSCMAYDGTTSLKVALACYANMLGHQAAPLWDSKARRAASGSFGPQCPAQGPSTMRTN